MNRSKLAFIILAFAVITGATLRVAGISSKKKIGIDEGISYITATGHGGEYIKVINEKLPPYGSWVQASKWKRFLLPEKLFCFKRIGYDLAHYDVHPPLYFWLLHVWFLLFSATILTGPMLNVIFFFPSALALFGLARYCLMDSLEAALVVFIWSLSPAVIQVSWVTRSYGLLVLCTIVFVWEIIRFSHGRGKIFLWDYIFLGVITMAGILTHYSFLLLISGGVVFWLLILAKSHKRHLIVGLFSIVSGCLLSLIFHPHFYRSFIMQQVQARGSPYGGIIFRMGRVFFSFLDFFVGNRVIQCGVLVVSIAIIIWLVIGYVKKRRGRINTADDGNFTGFYILYFLGWLGGSIALLYLIGINPLQQMGRRYLSMVYPFLAFVPVLSFRFVGRAQFPVTTCFCVLIFISGSVRVWRYMNNQRQTPALSALLQEPETVLIDNVSRLFLPGFLWHIPDDKLLFVANQDFLLKYRDDWLNNLGNSSVYISRAYKGEMGGQKKILEAIGQRYEISLIDRERLGNIFQIRPKH